MSEHDSWADPKYVKPADCDEFGVCVDCRSATTHRDGCIVVNGRRYTITAMRGRPVVQVVEAVSLSAAINVAIDNPEGWVEVSGECSVFDVEASGPSSPLLP